MIARCRQPIAKADLGGRDTRVVLAWLEAGKRTSLGVPVSGYFGSHTVTVVVAVGKLAKILLSTVQY